jgi:hypothetical protein
MQPGAEVERVDAVPLEPPQQGGRLVGLDRQDERGDAVRQPNEGLGHLFGQLGQERPVVGPPARPRVATEQAAEQEVLAAPGGRGAAGRDPIGGLGHDHRAGAQPHQVPQRQAAQVTEGPQGTAVKGAEPGLGGVLQQQQPPRPAPGEPGGGVLREPEMVGQAERAHPGPEQGLQVGGVGLQPGTDVVEAGHQPRRDQRRHRGPVLPCRGQDLVAVPEAERADAVQQRLTGVGEQPAAGRPQRERRLGRRPAQVGAGTRRRQDAEPA